MALERCPECKNKVSDRALVCGGCGFPLQKAREEEAIQTGIAFLVFGGPVAGVFIGAISLVAWVIYQVATGYPLWALVVLVLGLAIVGVLLCLLFWERTQGEQVEVGFFTRCQYCSQPFFAKEDWVGKLVSCPNCNQSVQIPKRQ